MSPTPMTHDLHATYIWTLDKESVNTQRGVSVQSPSYTVVLGGQMFILCRLVSEAAAKVCVVTGSSLCGRRLSFALKSQLQPELHFVASAQPDRCSLSSCFNQL